MFNFIKKLFGFDKETMKEAGVQTEQAPYKVEAPVVDLADIAIAQRPAPAVEPAPVVEAAPAVEPAPAKKPRKTRAEKPAAEKAAKPKKPAAMTAKKPGRKPKAK